VLSQDNSYVDVSGEISGEGNTIDNTYMYAAGKNNGFMYSYYFKVKGKNSDQYYRGSVPLLEGDTFNVNETYTTEVRIGRTYAEATGDKNRDGHVCFMEPCDIDAYKIGTENESSIQYETKYLGECVIGGEHGAATKLFYYDKSENKTFRSEYLDSKAIHLDPWNHPGKNSCDTDKSGYPVNSNSEAIKLCGKLDSNNNFPNCYTHIQIDQDYNVGTTSPSNSFVNATSDTEVTIEGDFFCLYESGERKKVNVFDTDGNITIRPNTIASFSLAQENIKACVFTGYIGDSGMFYGLIASEGTMEKPIVFTKAHNNLPLEYLGYKVDVHGTELIISPESKNANIAKAKLTNIGDKKLLNGGLTETHSCKDTYGWQPNISKNQSIYQFIEVVGETTTCHMILDEVNGDMGTISFSKEAPEDKKNYSILFKGFYYSSDKFELTEEDDGINIKMQ